MQPHKTGDEELEHYYPVPPAGYYGAPGATALPMMYPMGPYFHPLPNQQQQHQSGSSSSSSPQSTGQPQSTPYLMMAPSMVTPYPAAGSRPPHKFYQQRHPAPGGMPNVMTNTTNIYIRGLEPETTDDSLLQLVEPFGSLLSSKAILDLKTGVCKGYGFAMFETVQQAQKALNGLSKQGYMVTFAVAGPRGDTDQLEALFDKDQVESSKVLVDLHGNSRGVGFVRFKTREYAQQAIQEFHGKLLPGGQSPLQARFADTEGQKRLKGMFTRFKKPNHSSHHLQSNRGHSSNHQHQHRYPQQGSPPHSSSPSPTGMMAPGYPDMYSMDPSVYYPD